eukprot:Opistho-2@60187
MDDEKRKIRVPGPIVDAHNHFWDLDRWEYSFPSPDMEVLFRNYLPEHFVEHAGRAGVDKGIYVQVDHNEEEIPWVLELSERHASIAGVVGWVDLTHPDVGSRLDLHRAHSKFVGVRHLTHNESDNKWLMREDVHRGLAELASRGLAFDLLLRPQHLECVPPLAEKFPQLRLVIDHVAKPLIKDGVLDGWKEDIEAAAKHPNVYIKLSGMVTEADHERWTKDHLKPYVEHAVRCFGARRCMFGSDWPVCLLAAEYDEWAHTLHDILRDVGCSDDDVSEVFSGTATRFYRLDL